jgi:hypothetical protein
MKANENSSQKPPEYSILTPQIILKEPSLKLYPNLVYIVTEANMHSKYYRNKILRMKRSL